MSDLNKLPIGWEKVQLSDIAQVRSGNTPKGFEERIKPMGDFPWFKVGDMNRDGNEIRMIHAKDWFNHEDVIELGLNIFQPGTIIFPKRGGAIATNKKRILVVPSCIDLNTMAVIPDSALMPYVWMWISALNLAALSDGSNVPQINHGDINPLTVLVPPLNEQGRIVAKIEELFSDLDAGVAALKRAKANLKRYRAAVLKAAVEGKLTEEWRAKHPHTEPASKLLARILTERRQKWEADQLAKFAIAGKEPPKGWRDKYVEPTLPDQKQPLTLPNCWVVASLEQITHAERPICYGILMPKENVPDGILYVKVKDMKGDRIELDGLHRTRPEIAAEFARASLKRGDLLLSIRGTYGRVAEVPAELEGGNITQDTARLAVMNGMNHAFVATALRASECQTFFKRVARGVAVKGVNIGDVRECPIPIPPPNEQQQIVIEVSEKLSQIDAAELAIDHSLSRAARVRQSILNQAFEGKLVPQDPNDEPASLLLDRLSASRSISASDGNDATPTQKRGRIKKTLRSPE